MSHDASQQSPTTSVLAIWHDVVADGQEAFESWHSSQHLPERVTIPGISRARRYRRVGDSGEEYCSVLTIDGPSVLQSPEYLRRLNAPTPWTIAVSASYENFYRCAVTPDHAWVSGRAPYLVSIRVDLPHDDAVHATAERIWQTAAPLRESPTVYAMSVGAVQAAATSTSTSETTARHRTKESVTDLVLFVEVSDPDEAERLRTTLIEGIESAIADATTRSASYRAQFEIDEEIARPIYAKNLTDQSQYACAP